MTKTWIWLGRKIATSRDREFAESVWESSAQCDCQAQPKTIREAWVLIKSKVKRPPKPSDQPAGLRVRLQSVIEHDVTFWTHSVVPIDQANHSPCQSQPY